MNIDDVYLNYLRFVDTTHSFDEYRHRRTEHHVERLLNEKSKKNRRRRMNLNRFKIMSNNQDDVIIHNTIPKKKWTIVPTPVMQSKSVKETLQLNVECT